MKIFLSGHFKDQLKKLMRKFPHVKEDLLDSLEVLHIDNEISIGRSIYKIRIKSNDMKKGKSGGFRVYLYCYHKKDLLVPLCMYAKSQKESITETELQYHFDRTIEEIVLQW